MTNKKTKSQEKTLPEEGNDCAESPSEDRISLQEDKKVEYKIGEGEKGHPCAIKVRPC